MRIRRIAAAALAAALSLAAPSVVAQKKPDKKKEAEALLARVQATTDLRAPGSPPFRLRARVRLSAMDGGPYDGTYMLIWASPQHWREEVQFGEYQETRVLTGNTMWVKRTADFIPYRIFQLRQILQFPKRLAVGSQESVRKLLTPKENPTWLCVELGRSSRDREVCLARSPERLARYTLRGISSDSFYEAGEDYVVLEGKIHPRTLRYFDQGMEAINLTVELLSRENLDSAHRFESPLGAQAWPWCEGITGATAPRSTNDDLRHSSFQSADYTWSLAVFAVISHEGKATNLKLIQNDQPNLEQHALRVLQRTHFRPATCGGKPISSESILQFGLGQRVVSPPFH